MVILLYSWIRRDLITSIGRAQPAELQGPQTRRCREAGSVYNSLLKLPVLIKTEV